MFDGYPIRFLIKALCAFPYNDSIDLVDVFFFMNSDEDAYEGHTGVATRPARPATGLSTTAISALKSMALGIRRYSLQCVLIIINS